MGMNPRLLRPRQTTHPEAADWANRVRTAGGSVSGSTVAAVDRFVKSIYAAGLRDRFYRLNLFCGTSDASLIAPRVPLFRGQSFTGTQFGNTLDTNFNFVQGDYAETGASGGLVGNGSTKYLNTGFAHNILPQNDSHLGTYDITGSSGTFRVNGVRSGSTSGYLAIGTWSVAGGLVFLGFESGSSLQGSGVRPAHWLGNITGATTTTLFRNGVSNNTTSATTRTPGSEQITLFALNTAGSVGSHHDGRLGAYSFGLSFTSTQALAFYNAMQAFQTALSRNV